ncbi:hypothetical protein [Mumia sp. Pv 4-285]|uniref:hypothetical protein n=1 Tax=Mumia qirimensis TaxID=3234852 RepID=UPI00351D74D2
MPPPRSRLYGPLVSTSDLAAQRRLFVDVLGTTERGSALIDEAAAVALLGPRSGTTELVALQTPGVASGAVLCRFAEPAEQTVREDASPVDRDAFKVVDYYAPELEVFAAHARDLGHEVTGPAGPYDMAGTGLREAHLHGPDSLQVALLSGAAGSLDGYVEVTDRRVSEVLGITAPVGDVEAAVAFYADVLRWSVVHRYAIDGSSVARLVGVDEEVRMSGRCVGTAARESYVGLVDYGLPPEVGASLEGRAVPPRRGLLGAVVITDELDAVVRRAGERAGQVVALDLAPFGATRTVVLRPPYEVPHLVIEAIGVAW